MARGGERWSDIVEIDDSSRYFFVLERDGTLKGELWYGMADWTGIVELEGGFGVKADGSVLIDERLMGEDYTPEQLDEIRTWKVMVDPNCLPVKTAETP